ncbi:hypothetical protein [Mesorhizobium sp.]|uniref:hypothetical protein n=1 Tax=Mesorhizobium sp. TaxID=1871066 RepID=UPI000FE5AF8C|nr:hypothetical protein [Mesorhizobium sp.]RWA65359.1 MAG: hypothetical protein EOQ29_27270 [Mesorhizobium sp.]RWA79293.1 MAG: hypothetical protein EOQ30_26300 [Mesorhizobium sp.]
MAHALLDSAFKRIVVRYTAFDNVVQFEPPRDSASWLKVAGYHQFERILWNACQIGFLIA